MERTERKEKDENDKSVLPLTILYSTFFRPFQKPHQFTLPINSYPRVETFSKSFLRKEERETRMKKQKKKKKRRGVKNQSAFEFDCSRTTGTRYTYVRIFIATRGCVQSNETPVTESLSPTPVCAFFKAVPADDSSISDLAVLPRLPSTLDHHHEHTPPSLPPSPPPPTPYCLSYSMRSIRMVRVGQYIGGTSREGGSAKGLVHEENTRSRKEKARGVASRKRRGRRKVEENRARRRGGGERRSKRRREHREQGEKERVATTIEGEWRKHLPAAR